VRLTRLTLNNFRQHADTTLELGAGLTGIIGPNGSGKSTLLEAIAWAIYGTPAVRGSRDGIRFHRAAPRSSVRVELAFELGAHRYRVSRGLTSAELFLDGADEPIASGLTSVTDLLRRRIGMTREEFFNTYFTGQKELSVMAAMGPTDRAQFLSRVLGYERLKDAQELLRRERAVLNGQIASVRQGMPDETQLRDARESAAAAVARAGASLQASVERRGAADERLAAVTPRWEEAQARRDRDQALAAELRVAESEATACARDAERLERDRASVAEARSALGPLEVELAPLEALTAEERVLAALEREEGRRQALTAEHASLGTELERLRARLAAFIETSATEPDIAERLGIRRGELVEAEGALEIRRNEWTRDQQEAETRREALRRDYAEFKTQHEQLVAAGPEGDCPTCLRPLGASYQSVMDMLSEKMETVLVEGRYFRDRLEQLRRTPDDVIALDERRRALHAEVGDLERQLARLHAAAAERNRLAGDVAEKESRLVRLGEALAALPTGYDAARHAEVRRELVRLEPKAREAQRLRVLVERAPQIEAELADAAARIAAGRARLTSLAAERAAVAFSEAAFLEVRADYGAAADAARAAALAAVAAEGELARARAELDGADRAMAALVDRRRQLEDLLYRKRLHDDGDRAYADFRSELNGQLRPDLSELASGFLAELTDGRYSELELDTDYGLVVHEEGIPKPVISGGEEDLANLVLRLAISQMIAERAGQPLTLLVLDEIFGSLDEARRTNVLELLRRLHDRFDQVILITHIESVREALDRLVTVRYDAATGSSVVDGGLLAHDVDAELPALVAAGAE
jgi:DNA repair protein SbcC/Rad50